MERWEYLVVDLRLGKAEGEVVGRSGWQERLNELGSECWELVTVEGWANTAYLKRPIGGSERKKV